MAATTILLDPLLDDDAAATIVALCEQFGAYALYVAETSASTFAAGLSQRHDAAANYVRTGGRFKRTEALGTLAQRTNFFRESYAYGETISAPRIGRGAVVRFKSEGRWSLSSDASDDETVSETELAALLFDTYERFPADAVTNG